MREIKFRAWDNKLKKIVHVRTLKYIEDIDREKGILFRRLDYISIRYHVDDIIQDEGRDVDSIILMQFTGLYDKNGKEIWEGDIVKFKSISGFGAEKSYRDSEDNEEEKRVVEFKNGEFTPRPKAILPDDGYYAWRHWDFEVIGNIYENPELMQVVK